MTFGGASFWAKVSYLYSPWTPQNTYLTLNVAISEEEMRELVRIQGELGNQHLKNGNE